MIIAEEPYKQDEVLLILDIGTNGELVLGNRHEDALHLVRHRSGLRGLPHRVRHASRPGRDRAYPHRARHLDVRFKVIGLEGWHTDYPPEQVGARGICGSGIIEAAAEMLKAGVILANGNLDPAARDTTVSSSKTASPGSSSSPGPRRRPSAGPSPCRSKTSASLQLAKAALRAGEEILLRRYGVEKPDGVVMAGAFGTYIDKHHALAIGMLPDCDPSIVTSVGNAAGDGARFALLSLEKRREAAWAAREAEFVELAIDPDFQRQYVKAMYFQPVVDIPED